MPSGVPTASLYCWQAWALAVASAEDAHNEYIAEKAKRQAKRGKKR